MKPRTPQAGFTVLEMAFAIVIIALLSAIYFFLIDSYSERRMSEQAAKVLMLAAKAQEDYFAKEHRYFDAEVAGQGTDLYLSSPDGRKTDVLVPGKVILSLKTRGKEKTAFTGYAFYTGSKVLHRYDSETGKVTTSSRTQDDAG
jgi:prepilin-type N-terminal cleavage/methylation domain-containing protein